MKVTCEKHPELNVFDLGVKFSKGVSEVADADILRKLNEMNGFGFVFEEEIPAPQPEGGEAGKPATKKAGKKADDEQGTAD